MSRNGSSTAWSPRKKAKHEYTPADAAVAAEHPLAQADREARGQPDEEFTPTVKCYKNQAFLNSRAARSIRVLCEYEEPKQRLEAADVKNTVLFFASARGKSHAEWQKTVDKIKQQLADPTATDDKKRKLEADLQRWDRLKWQCDVYDTIRELGRKVAEWGVARTAQGRERISVCTGGGPGMMEAANQGASEVDGAVSMGMGISLPFEKGNNKYVTPEMAFEFHYFFTRKFWMVYPCKALIVAPGGFGTCDELFEVLTLMQTGKQPVIPIVLIGEAYWRRVIDWDAMVEFGTIAQTDIERLFFTDSVDAALAYLKKALDA